MEVVVLESKLYQSITEAVESIKTVIAENQQLKDDRWLTVEEAAAHLGFEKQWVLKRKVQLKAFQEGMAVKFRKSDLDAYMTERQLIENRKRN
jgi:hypothetical protein